GPVGSPLAVGRVVHLEYERGSRREPHGGAFLEDPEILAWREAAHEEPHAAGRRRTIVGGALSGRVRLHRLGLLHVRAEGERTLSLAPRVPLRLSALGALWRTRVHDDVVNDRGVTRLDLEGLNPLVLGQIRRHL